MLDLLHSRSNQTHTKATTPICLNREFRADLVWWSTFIECWNSVSFRPKSKTHPFITVASDASGQWGCGAWWGPHWFQIQWSGTTKELQIAIKELLPVVIGCAIWGHAWSKRQVIWYCNNQPVHGGLCLVQDQQTPNINAPTLELGICGGSIDFHLHPEYIDTHANHIADDLSRDYMYSFFSKVLQPHQPPLQSHQHSWTFSCTHRATGSHYTGAVSSTIF